MADASTHTPSNTINSTHTPNRKTGEPAQRPCSALTKAGTPCTRKAQANGLCVVHDPERLAEAARKRSATTARRERRDGWTKADLVLPEKPTLKDVMRVQAAVTALLAQGDIQKEVAFNVLNACKQDVQILGSKALEKANDKQTTQVIDVAVLSREAERFEKDRGEFTRERGAGGGPPPNSTPVIPNPSEPLDASESVEGGSGVVSRVLEALGS